MPKHGFLIEDSDEWAEIIADKLDPPYSVVRVQNGYDAIALLDRATSSFDAVIVDCGISPITDNYKEFLKEVRKKHQGIILGAILSPEDEKPDLINAGITKFCFKDDLASEIQSLLPIESEAP